MINNTVLVVDAVQETAEKIVSTLETEGYQVLTASGQDISAEMADKVDPSLIYLQATSNTIQVCNTIHAIEKFRKIPIILLASLSETLDVQAFFDGIVDYLQLPVNLSELVEKTVKILGSASDLKGTKEDIGLRKEETLPAAEPSKVKDEYSYDTKTDEISEIAQQSEDYSDTDEKKDMMESRLKKIRLQPYRSGLLTPFRVVMTTIVILAAGLFLYKFFISKPKIPLSVPVKSEKAVEYQETEVLPPQEQQKQEELVYEEKPREEPVQTEQVIEEEPTVNNEAPKAAPQVDAPITKVTEKPFYSVQLGAFKIETNADALAMTYTQKGYEVFIHDITAKDDKILYLVLIGKFENRKEASQIAEYIRTKEKIETTVFRGKAK